MKLVLKLGELMETLKRSLFEQGFTYDEADDMCRIIFEETGLKFEGFMQLDKEDLRSAITHFEKYLQTV